MTAEGAHARHCEQHIRRLLAEHADTVIPGDGITAIRARIARRPWWRRAWDAVRAFDRWMATGFASITLTPHSTNGAPDAPGTPPITTAVKEPTMTIISRHARDLHAGDVITEDPDHDDRPVRWRVQRPPVFTRGGEYALTNVTDLATGDEHVTYYPVLQLLSVEPVGGARQADMNEHRAPRHRIDLTEALAFARSILGRTS